MKRILLFIAMIISFNFHAHSEWERVSNGIEGVSPSLDYITLIDNTVYLGTATSSGIGQGLFVSSDFGTSWKNLGLENKVITSITKINNSLLVGTENNGVYFTSDNGNNWEQRNNGLPSGNKNGFINTNSLVIIGDTIFINIITQEIFFTTNLGLNWQKISNDPNLSVEQLYSTGDNLIVTGYDGCISGSFISSDKGLSWNKVEELPGGYSENSNMIKLKNKLFYYNSSNAINISNDEGFHWIAKELASEYENIHIVSVNSWRDTIFAVSSNGIVFFSFDNGNAFYQRNKNNLPINESFENAIVQDKILGINSNENTYYFLPDMDNKWQVKTLNVRLNSSTWDICRYSGNLILQSSTGIYQSSDFGLTWLKYSGYPYYPINEIKSINDDKLVFVTLGGYSISDDGGKTWSHSSVDLSGAISTIEFYDDIYLIATYQSGFYYSLNKGKDWSKLENAKYSTENHLAFKFKNKIFTYAKFFGLYSTEDFGSNWVQIVPGSSYHSINAYTKSDSAMYLLSGLTDFVTNEYSEYLLYSIDGNNWNSNSIQFKNYLNNDIGFYCFRGIQDKLFVGPSSGGLFYTSDNGKNWIDMSKGIENLVVNDCINLGEYLYITTTKGVYRDKLTEFGLGVKDNEIVDESLISPNPASDYIIIGAKGPSPLREDGVSGEIKIFDIFGKPVLSVETQCIASLQKIDISALPAGVYFVRIGEKVEKFVKM